MRILVNTLLCLKNIPLKNNVNVELHLFEPTKSCFDIISKKFKHIDNLYLNNFGVSNTNTKATIFMIKRQVG